MKVHAKLSRGEYHNRTTKGKGVCLTLHLPDEIAEDSAARQFIFDQAANLIDEHLVDGVLKGNPVYKDLG